MEKNFNNYLKSYKYFNIIILPIILFILTKLFYGFYFETNDDYVMSLIFKGEWQSQGGAYEISMVHKLMSYAYVFLYKQIPGIPWYGFILCLFNLTATVITFNVFENILSKFLNQFKVSVFLVFLYTILILENVTLINFTRTAIFLAGSSLLLLLYAVLGVKKYERRTVYVVVCSLFFIIGFMIRPRAGILVPIVTLPFALYMGLKLMKFKSALYVTIAFSLFAAVLHYSSLLLKTPEEHANDKFSAYWVNATEYELGKPIYISNEQDSIKKEALRYYFVIDKKEFTNDFLERISSSDIFSSSKLTLHRFKVAVIYISITVFKYYPGITIFNLFVFMIAVFGFLKKKKSQWILYLIPHFVFWLLLFLIFVFMKLPYRLFASFYSIYTLCNFWQMQGLEFSLNSKRILLFL